MGPEGGERGGTVIATGTPEEIAVCPDSYTGQYVAKYLKVNGRLLCALISAGVLL